MRCLVLVVIIAVAVVSNTTCSFLNNGLAQIKPFAQPGDPGEPLYLTKYIERGDVLKVGENNLK